MDLTYSVKSPIQILLALEIPPGDILDSKNGSDRWWKKQKQNWAHEDNLDSHFSNQEDRQAGRSPWQNNEDDQVGYEYKYPDGGGVHYSRLHMICGDQGPHDSCTTYYNVSMPGKAAYSSRFHSSSLWGSQCETQTIGDDPTIT